MSGKRTISRSNVVNFFAAEVTDAAMGYPLAHDNDNACPYCGGLLEPGDNAADCSGVGWRRVAVHSIPEGLGRLVLNSSVVVRKFASL